MVEIFISASREKKVGQQAKAGARIVCNYFYFPNLVPKQVENFVVLYIKD